jgi:uncharacterized OB-fold protein
LTDSADSHLDLARFIGSTAGPAVLAPDAVNAPMIRHFCEAIGDRNPIHVDAGFAASTPHGGIVAPPAMLQAWILGRRDQATAGEAPGNLAQLFALLEAEEGLDSIVATDCVQEYDRYLAPGDVVAATEVIESISAPKNTGLGRGRFINTLITYTDQHGERIATQRFRLLRFRARERSVERSEVAPVPSVRPRPVVGRDNEFFWQGVARGEFLIQRCVACRSLRHPPRPMCSKCRSLEWDTVVASRRATVHSFVVSHYPVLPSFEYPLVIVLGQLEEGTRYVANLMDVDPSSVEVGMPVQIEIRTAEDGLALPVFVAVER